MLRASGSFARSLAASSRASARLTNSAASLAHSSSSPAHRLGSTSAAFSTAASQAGGVSIARHYRAEGAVTGVVRGEGRRMASSTTGGGVQSAYDNLRPAPGESIV